MKHLQVERKVELRMELKVCEGCGTLWVRSLAGGVYCNRCALLLADFPRPASRKRRGRKPRTLREMAGGTEVRQR